MYRAEPDYSLHLCEKRRERNRRGIKKNLQGTFGFLLPYQGSNQCKEVGNELDQECLIKLSDH